MHYENPQASLQCSNRGSFFLYTLAMSITFPKHYKTPEELVELLSERGLYIQERNSACQYIKNIGYYRLSAYLYPFLKLPKEKQLFKDGSTLEGALMLYRFDKKMRMFLLNEIEKVEIAFRSALANMVAQETGNIFWMTDKEMFTNADKFNRTMDKVKKEFEGSKEDFILHFKKKYSNAYPPAWMLVEILPLGVITRIFENLRDNALKKKIASTFGLTLPVFCSWMTVITLTRNSCCHHSRVWNRTYAVGPMIPKKMSRPWIGNSVSHLKTFYEICIVKWFVDIISPQNNLKDRLTDLLASFPHVDCKAMGFPTNWADEPLWKA